jgi:hypothetical protein
LTVPPTASVDLHDAVVWHPLHGTASLNPRAPFEDGTASDPTIGSVTPGAFVTPAADRRSCGLA